MSALVEIKDVCKVYNPGENEVRALDHVSLTIDEQEFVAIIGHSGSGKSPQAGWYTSCCFASLRSSSLCQTLPAYKHTGSFEAYSNSKPHTSV